MKNIYILILLIVGLSIDTFAGEKFGIRAGWQTANIYNSSTYFGKNVSSFYVGIYKEKKLFPLLKIGTGIEYSQAGTKMNSSNELRLHLVSIPLYARLKLGPVYALGGVAPSFKIAESWNVSSPDFIDKDQFKGQVFDLPVFAGVGFNILLLRIEARYFFGTLDISNNVAFDGYKNRYLQLGLGLSI